MRSSHACRSTRSEWRKRGGFVLLGALLASLLGCPGDDPRFRRAQINVDTEEGSAELTLPGGGRRPCPTLRGEATVEIGGVSAVIQDPGGENRDPDVDYGGCRDVRVSAEGVPLLTGRLPVLIEGEDGEIGMDTDWPAAHRVETGDDLAVALRDGVPFGVTWTPVDARRPELSLYQDGFPFEQGGVELVEESPGSARFRFTGSTPEEPWGLVAASLLVRQASVCDLEECVYLSDLYIALR